MRTSHGLSILSTAVVCIATLRNIWLAPVALTRDETAKTQSEEQPADETATEIDNCAGKEKFLSILKAAGFNVENRKEACQSLPFWNETASLYGDQPVVLGLETCEQYRALLSAEKNNGTASEPLVRVAGLYNTGTNAFSMYMYRNFKAGNLEKLYMSENRDSSYIYRVPWDKHVPYKYKWKATYRKKQEKKEHVLPVVMIRDPYRWMKSMCKMAYYANWTVSSLHCPNLVVSPEDLALYPHLNGSTTFRVKDKATDVYYIRATDHYDSLADMWTQWNEQYFNSTEPRLIIRYEDLIFHTETVLKLIGKCAGLPMKYRRLKYITKAAKGGIGTANFVSALQKYGSIQGRTDGMTREDVEYASKALSPAIMKQLNYKYE